MPKLSQPQQAKRRAHILDSAEICFANAGFHRTTMQDICRQARVSAGAVYVYFDSKEALIDGIVERDRDEIAHLLGLAGEAGDLFASLRGLLQACVLERPAHKVALYIEMIAESHRNPRVAAAVQGCDAVLGRALTDLLARARAEGKIAASIDPQVAAQLLTIVGDGIFVHRSGRPQADIAALVPHILMMIERYLSEGAPTTTSADGSVSSLATAVPVASHSSPARAGS